MKRLIISGAGGFLGKNLILEAIYEDIPVLAISTHPEILKTNKVETVSTEQFLQGEIQLSENDVFINCMFPTNADGIQMATGLKNVYSAIRAAKKSGVGAFINISSQSVYASHRITPANENDQLSLETPYAVGKYSTEIFSNEVFQEIPHTNIRLASLLGVGYEQRIVNRMITRALKSGSLQVVGGMQRYGFLDVRDAALGLITISQSDENKWKPVYNLGRMESCTLLDVVKMIVEKLQERGYSTEYTITEGSDTRNSAIDASLFMKDFDWKPHISLEQTVNDIINQKLIGGKL